MVSKSSKYETLRNYVNNVWVYILVITNEIFHVGL
jgi:hypothetical protein